MLEIKINVEHAHTFENNNPENGVAMTVNLFTTGNACQHEIAFSEFVSSVITKAMKAMAKDGVVEICDREFLDVPIDDELDAFREFLNSED